MNIVKIKSDVSTEALKDYAGKYMIAVRFKWLFPLESLDIESYIEYESVGVPEEKKEIAYDQNDIDYSSTVKANNIDKYIGINKLIDEEISIDDLKVFRTWLASSILGSGDPIVDLEGDEKIMLNYYANGMTDDVIMSFAKLSAYTDTVTLGTSNVNTCGCTTNAQLTMMKNQIPSSLMSSMLKAGTYDLSNITVSTCDPIYMYRRYVYNCMVATFRDINFWNEMPEEFISLIIKYLEGIIKNNFPLSQSDYLSTFADCDCLSNASTMQMDLTALLERLKTSFGYILSGEVKEHKNYISTTLYEWASKLYEKMEWA